MRTRLFAFLVTSLASEFGRSKKRDSESDLVYLINMALMVGRLCIEDADLEGSRLALQKVADYMERLEGIPDKTADSVKLEAEYLTMRTALVGLACLSLVLANELQSWKEDRLDVAEHMYSKTNSLRHCLDASSAEHMADTLQHIGSDLSSKGDFGMALKWLRRAYELINSQDLGKLSSEGLQLRLTICHDLIQALLGTGSTEDLQEATDLVAYVESELGNKPVVLHWRLEILQKSPGEVFDTEAYASVLRSMIRSVDLSDSMLSFLLHHVKELREKSSRLAIGLLDELLLSRLIQSKNEDWVGKAIVRRTWMSTMESDPCEGAVNLTKLLQSVPVDTNASLNPVITGAVHSVSLNVLGLLLGLTWIAHMEENRSPLHKKAVQSNSALVSSRPSLCFLQLRGNNSRQIRQKAYPMRNREW